LSHQRQQQTSLASAKQDVMGWSWLDTRGPTKAALSLPLLRWTGNRKYNERLVGRGKEWDNSHHRQNRLNLGN